MMYTNKEGKPRGQASQRKGYTMSRFIITANGHAVSHVPSFLTHNEAVIYIGNVEMSGQWEVTELPAETKPVTCTCIDYAGDFDEAGQPSLECFGCDSGRLAPIDYVAMLATKEKELIELTRKLDVVRENRDYHMDKFAKVTSFIQSSIDRDEWTSAELEELFWEELAEMLGLDLKQTEEKEVTFTVTYTATVTVPKNADLDDLELDIEAYPTVTYRSEDVGEARHNETEVTED